MPSTLAAVAIKPHADLEISELEISEPKGNEILVRTVASGICHTDLLLRDGLFGPAAPVVPGHEGAGVVIAIGPAVHSLAVGDHVAMSQSSCGVCRHCRGAHPMSCANYDQYNLTGLRPNGKRPFVGSEVNGNFVGQSSFSSHILATENNAARLPKDLPLELAAPLGCGMVTGAGAVMNVLNPRIGSTLVVFGAGAVGLAAVMAASVRHCATIIAVDLNAARLELALTVGATHVVNPANGNPVDQVHEITAGGADCAIDAVGKVRVVQDAVRSTRRGGHTVLLGLDGLAEAVPLDLELLVFNRRVEGAILGDQIPQQLIPQLVQLYQKGRFPFDRLVRQYPFADINTAIADAVRGDVIKPVIVF